MLKKLAKNRRLNLLVLLLILLLALPLALRLGDDTPPPKPTPLAAIMKEIAAEKDGEIKEIVLEDAKRTVTIVYEDKKEASKTSSYPTDYGTVILEAAEKEKIEVNVNNQFGVPQTLGSVLLSLIPLVLILSVVVLLIVMTMGSGRSSKPVSEIPTVRFKDIGGVNEAIEDMGEVTDFLSNSDKFKAIGAKAPSGVLLAGPPGTGKTLIAKAVAGEAGVPFFQASGSDFMEMFVGMGARRVRNLFKAAKKHERAIIFIDEIDSVGGKRGSGSDGADSREHNRTITALLTEMDGFEESNIIVLAATNNPGELDEALTRAGRFDRKISVDLPDWKGRVRILEIHSKGKPLAEDVDLEVLSKTTTGLSGADLANLVNEALINAVRNGRKAANNEDFMEALSIVTIGRARTSSVITDSDKEVTAYHEAGHAVVGLALDELADPSHVTIVARGFSGGHTKLQESENKFQTSTMLKARLAMMMGGLAAERRKLGDITQGPGSDLQQATDLAQRMVSKMGMGDTFTVVADQSIMVNSAVSDAVREQAESLIVEAVETATKILDDPKWNKVFERMSEKLLEFDSIENDEIQELKKLALKGSK